ALITAAAVQVEAATYADQNRAASTMTYLPYLGGVGDPLDLTRPIPGKRAVDTLKTGSVPAKGTRYVLPYLGGLGDPARLTRPLSSVQGDHIDKEADLAIIRVVVLVEEGQPSVAANLEDNQARHDPADRIPLPRVDRLFVAGDEHTPGSIDAESAWIYAEGFGVLDQGWLACHVINFEHGNVIPPADEHVDVSDTFGFVRSVRDVDVAPARMHADAARELRRPGRWDSLKRALDETWLEFHMLFVIVVEPQFTLPFNTHVHPWLRGVELHMPRREAVCAMLDSSPFCGTVWIRMHSCKRRQSSAIIGKDVNETGHGADLMVGAGRHNDHGAMWRHTDLVDRHATRQRRLLDLRPDAAVRFDAVYRHSRGVVVSDQQLRLIGVETNVQRSMAQAYRRTSRLDGARRANV